MSFFIIKLIQLFLIITSCQLLLATAPLMKPVGQLLLNEGDTLEITCESSSPIVFYPPESENQTTPIIKDSRSNNIHVSKFRLENTIYLDTGWYGCADDGVPITPKVYDQPDVSWLYVYVQSNTNLLLKFPSKYMTAVNSETTAEIPCRPTSPNYTVEITFDDKTIDMTNEKHFDPRIGLVIEHLTMDHGGFYKCVVNHAGISSEAVYLLNVNENVDVNKPIIDLEPLRYVVHGQEVRVNCSADVETHWSYTLNWIPKQKSSRIKVNAMHLKFGQYGGMEIRELVITNIAYEDEGEYTCEFKVFQNSNSTSTFIKVHDPGKKFLNLSAASNQKNYEQILGSNVLWIVEFTGYPIPEITWFDPRNETIVSDNNKYEVNVTQSKSSLRIRDLKIADTGIYTLEAASRDGHFRQIERLTFNLSVLAAPVVMDFKNISPYYLPYEEVEFRCVVAAYPKPNITWSFQPLSQSLSERNSETYYPTNFIITEDYSQFESILKMKLETSGILSCMAQNELDSESYQQTIFVSDVPHGFGITGPSSVITVGDNVNLTCGASIHNYTDSVEWVLDEEFKKLVDEKKKFIIEETQTPFSYQSILRIIDINKSDEKRLYTCTASMNGGIIKQDEKRLVVNDPAKPYFIEVNMNGTENTYDSETARMTIITFKCHVGGMPPPVISWWKDNQILNATDDLYIFANGDRELEIKHPRTSDSGKYFCRAQNRLGRIERFQIITVHGEKVSEVLIISMVILLIICVILVIYFSIKMHREKVMRKQLMEAGLTHFEEGALECLNPELTVDDQAELLPYDKKWEFPRERLKFGKQLGCGAFGVVMKAEAEGICENESSTTVAVKMVRRSTESTYIRALASELKIMVHLGKHLNVVNLLGACTRNIAKRELLVIVEYCRFGNLHNYLLRHRSDFINQLDPETRKIDPLIGRELLIRSVSVGSNNRIKYAALSFSRSISMNSNSGPELVSYTSGGSDSQGVSMSPDGMILSNNSVQPGWRSNYRGDYKDQNLKPICTQDLLSWAFQVARGMEYLSQRKVLHGDLAARNILLAENNIVKICDFGLAKTMYKDENYKKKGDAPLPIKWMAIESIRDRVFSTQSDIWSFGIVLWEFFTLAETPYPGMEAEKQYQKLIEGYRMENPEFATDDIYNIMLECWKAKPSLRPTFTDLVQNIGSLLDESVKMHYLDLNTPYMDMNTMIFENGKNDYLTMMSAPDHETLSSPTGHQYVNSPNIPLSPATDCSYLCMTPANPKEDTKIFSPRNVLEKTHFDFPAPDHKSNLNSDSESEAVELSPMLKDEDDNYLKPINVQGRRAEFVRQRQEMKNSNTQNELSERESSYCNAPQSLRLIEIHDSAINDKKNTLNKNINGEHLKKHKNTYIPGIIRTEDNYVNMPNHKMDLKRDAPDSFTNPSYVFMAKRESDESKV